MYAKYKDRHLLKIISERVIKYFVQISSHDIYQLHVRFLRIHPKTSNFRTCLWVSSLFMAEDLGKSGGVICITPYKQPVNLCPPP